MKFTSLLPVTLVATALFASAAPAKAQQKPGAAQPTQAQLEERIRQLEDRLAKVENKAEGAAMEKDYITRIQKQYETYYEKAFNTQIWILSILSIILTAVFFVAGKFTFDIFDGRIKSALDAALAQVEKKFSEQMQTKLETLSLQNSAQLKDLEDGLTKRIVGQEEQLKARSDFQFYFSQGSRDWPTNDRPTPERVSDSR